MLPEPSPLGHPPRPSEPSKHCHPTYTAQRSRLKCPSSTAGLSQAHVTYCVCVIDLSRLGLSLSNRSLSRARALALSLARSLAIICSKPGLRRASSSGVCHPSKCAHRWASRGVPSRASYIRRAYRGALIHIAIYIEIQSTLVLLV